MRHGITRVVRNAVGATALTLLSVGAAAAQQTAEPTKVDVSSGGLTVSSGVNTLTLGARVQFRWTLDHREDADTDTAGSGRGTADGALMQFDVPRLRVTLGGGAFRPWLRYTFQFDFSRTSGEGDSKIKDALIEIRPTGRPYRLTVGQFKAPFGLQQLTSSGRQQFVDRAITDAKFAPGRDMGAMVSGTLAARKVGYEFGAFNGSGESTRQTKKSSLWAGRVFVQPRGAYSLAEGATDAGDGLVVHLGLAVRAGSPIRGRSTAGIVEDADSQAAYSLEFALKSPRVYSTAECFVMIDEQQNPVALADLRSRGFHAQAGVMVRPRTVELGVRVASIEADTDIDDAALTEVRGVVGYFWRAHNLKLQADIGQLRYGPAFSTLSSRARSGLVATGVRLVAGEALADAQARVQLQVAF